MAKLALTPEVLNLIAHRFKVLAESARLEILNTLREREMTVGELVEKTEFGQANVSKHLQICIRMVSSTGAGKGRSSTIGLPMRRCSSFAT